jgi:tetratricopeptide (TPR) repeat protein
MKTKQKKYKKHAHLYTAPAALLALAFAATGASAQVDPKDPIRKAPRHAAAKAAKPRAAAVPGKAAFNAADAGYKAFDRREYGIAVDRAEEAVRLAPAKADYWLLLVNSLTAAGRYAEADQAIERGTRAAGGGARFAQARESLRRAQAQASGDAMYKALQAGDVQGAIAHARAAVNYAPEHPAYRLALVQALLRGGNYVEAEKIAGETIALLPDSAAPLALRAYARQRTGHWPEARADLDRALGLVPTGARR